MIENLWKQVYWKTAFTPSTLRCEWEDYLSVWCHQQGDTQVTPAWYSVWCWAWWWASTSSSFWIRKMGLVQQGGWFRVGFSLLGCQPLHSDGVSWQIDDSNESRRRTFPRLSEGSNSRLLSRMPHGTTPFSCPWCIIARSPCVVLNWLSVSTEAGSFDGSSALIDLTRLLSGNRAPTSPAGDTIEI
jgi:hypothetical protein